MAKELFWSFNPLNSKKMKKKHILLIEDDAEVRNYLRETMSNSGFTVHEAENGTEGIEALKKPENIFDVILSDLRMPETSGIEVAKFNYANRYFPFVVYTAVVDSELALQLLPFGVQDYLIKPVSVSVLLGVLNNAIERRSLSASMKPEENPYLGNVGAITIPSRNEEVGRAVNWVEDQLTKTMTEDQRTHFMIYITELFQNAHEHGNLRVSEKVKTDLLQKNEFETFLAEREKKSAGKIQIALSVLNNTVSVNIIDGGNGFDYNKYLNMSEEEIIQRLSLPNGRGIFMANQFFDSIRYSKGGASVTVTKKLSED